MTMDCATRDNNTVRMYHSAMRSITRAARNRTATTLIMRAKTKPCYYVPACLPACLELLLYGSEMKKKKKKLLYSINSSKRCSFLYRSFGPYIPFLRVKENENVGSGIAHRQTRAKPPSSHNTPRYHNHQQRRYAPAADIPGGRSSCCAFGGPRPPPRHAC